MKTRLRHIVSYSKWVIRMHNGVIMFFFENTFVKFLNKDINLELIIESGV